MNVIFPNYKGIWVGLMIFWMGYWTGEMTWFWHLLGRCDVSGPQRQHVVRKLPNITPVYIIEEHHEALLYWFDAAEKGLIKQQGNVLLHIDAHSDGAVPMYRDVLPLFRMPKNISEIYNMMQRNDVFCVAAALTGLIHRYIWVWPPFDLENHATDHLVFDVKLGAIREEEPDGTVIEDVCACLHPRTEHSLFTEDVCVAPETDPESEEEQRTIELDECDIIREGNVLEMVSEEMAIQLLKTDDWITDSDTLILDIDEDYYGCEAAVQPLYDVDIWENSINRMKNVLSRLFCPTEPWQEKEADIFYAEFIDRVINLNTFCVQMNNSVDMCHDHKSKKRYLLNSTDVLFQELKTRKLSPALCSFKTTKTAIKALINIVAPYTVEQLQVIKEIGICFNTSPRTLYFNPLHGMKTGDGFNRPNDTSVLFYTPTDEDIDFRTQQLKVMLASEHLHPGVVTMCRSMRDGYTPRKYVHRIERDVLNLLLDRFETINNYSIFYDPYLLGGVHGWPGRH